MHGAVSPPSPPPPRQKKRKRKKLSDANEADIWGGGLCAVAS